MDNNIGMLFAGCIFESKGNLHWTIYKGYLEIYPCYFKDILKSIIRDGGINKITLAYDCPLSVMLRNRGKSDII